MAYITSLETAVPDYRFTQKDCWEILQKTIPQHALSPISMRLLERVLTQENGIETRYFSSDPTQTLLSADADQLNLYFREAAPALAQKALQKALDAQGLKSDQIDALFVCTCTGYLCPGISSYVAEKMEMRSNVYLHDLVGLGCGASIPTLRSGHAFLAAHPEANVACVAVEISSAAFYLDEDPGVLISACLFGDGAAAVILKSSPLSVNDPGIKDFRTSHHPDHRDLLRFETRKGRLRNLLHRSVPQVAGEIVGGLWTASFKDQSLPQRVISHGGGRDVLDVLSKRFAPFTLEESRLILKNYGNMSSPSVLFALKEAMSNRNSEETKWWMTSFGAGFSAHSCHLEWTKA